jgi:hypothetical protein
MLSPSSFPYDRGLYMPTEYLHGYALRDHDSPPSRVLGRAPRGYYAQGNSWVGVESLIAGTPAAPVDALATGTLDRVQRSDIATGPTSRSQPDRKERLFGLRNAMRPPPLSSTNTAGYVYIFQNAPFNSKCTSRPLIFS